jgi:hypothetical protein
MGPDASDKDTVALRVLWRGMEDHPLLYVNQFLMQHDQDELILTVGQFQPPILLGEPHERVEQARQLGYVPVHVVARLAFTRARLGELSRILQDHLDKYDQAHRD